MKNYRSNLTMLFVASALLAAFAYNLFILNEADYNLNDIMNKLGGLGGNVNAWSVLPYILFKRLKQALIICILLRAFKQELVIDVMIIAFGVFLGMMITAQTYLHGLNGFVLFVLCFIPHFPIYIFLIRILYNLNNSSYHDKQFWGYFFMSISVFLIGVICEAFFSIFFLKGFYQHLVL